MTRGIETGTVKLRAEVDDAGVGWVVLDDPERHNAIGAEMIAALPAALGALDTDPEVRVVVVRGAGERAFASGADLAEQRERVEGGGAATASADRMFAGIGAHALLAMTTPVIAMVRGWCLGGGLLLALCADLRVAADDAVFSIPAARLGVAYPYEATELLVQLAGPEAAAELLFTGDRIDAARALELGLVGRVVPAADLAASASALAATIAARAPLSVQAAKASIRRAAGGTGAPSLDQVHRAIEAAWRADDVREGMAAFAERREPQFRGR